MRIAEILNELSFQGSTCTKDCSGHAAGYEWSMKNGGKSSNAASASFNKGARIASDQIRKRKVTTPKMKDAEGNETPGLTPKVQNPGTIPSRGPTNTP